jgi:hypothetical protein
MAGEKGSGYANGLLLAIFNADFSNLATFSLMRDAASPLTQLWLSLHSADPTAAGNQSTNEVVYSSYARIGVARTSSGFTVTTNSVALAATMNFPKCTGGTATATYFGIGTASSGTGYLLYAGPITPSIAISNQVIPELTSGTIITEV